MARIFYYEVDDFLRKEERYKLLENAKNVYGVEWNEITPDKNHVWLTEGMEDDWENYNKISLLFNHYNIGVQTGRDTWAYNFNKSYLEKNIKNHIDYYNELLYKYNLNKINDFFEMDFVNDETKIKWTSSLKSSFERSIKAEFNKNFIINSLFRPFTKEYLNFDKLLVHRRSHFHKIYPNVDSEKENLVICLTAVGNDKPFHTLMTNCIPDLHLTGDSQCFPFYTYDEDGTNRKENISDWSLNEFQKQYKDDSITKWDIFYYIYGVLHKPEYRIKYAANLKRELPRIPFYDDFWKYADAGKKLADLHVNYESQPEYYLEKIEASGKKLDYIVEKMKYNKDKTAIIYNDFLTLSGIPPETFDYKLGNRSALDWIVDQYQIKTDKRSGIVNDPNRLDEPDYIITLIGKIITVSLETVKIVNGLRDTEGELSKVVEGE